MSKIEIEKGVPLIPGKRGAISKYPLSELEVGDSFLTDSVASACSLWIRISKKTGRKFTSRKVEGGHRVWRIA